MLPHVKRNLTEHHYVSDDHLDNLTNVVHIMIFYGLDERKIIPFMDEDQGLELNNWFRKTFRNFLIPNAYVFTRAYHNDVLR